MKSEEELRNVLGMVERSSLTSRFLLGPTVNSLYTCDTPKAHTASDLSAKLQLEPVAYQPGFTRDGCNLQIPGELEDM